MYCTEAVKSQKEVIVDLLSSAGCDVNMADRDFLFAPIHAAVRQGKNGFYKLIL